MSTARALLADVDVFLAEGNIRRGVGKFANNMLAASANSRFQEQKLTVVASTSEVISSVSGNVATIIRCTKPIKITVTVAPSTMPTVFSVASLFIYTGELGDLTIANDSATVDSKVTFLQI
jgi:hypothetical protein